MVIKCTQLIRASYSKIYMVRNLEKLPTWQDSGWPEQGWLFCIGRVVSDLVRWQSVADILAVPSYFSDRFLLVSTRVKKKRFPFQVSHLHYLSSFQFFLTPLFRISANMRRYKMPHDLMTLKI